MENEKSFLGTGWSFPPEFNAGTAGILMVSEEDDIKQSIEIILTTRPGERLMRPEFGCGINELVFETMDTSQMTYARKLIETAILRYESRITLNKIDFEVEELQGILFIHIQYTIRKTNTRSNMVYPFYLKEGTNIKDKI